MLYRSLSPHSRKVRQTSPDFVLVKTSSLDDNGIVREVVSSELVSSDVTRAALDGMRAQDFSISVAVVTGNVDNLRPCPVIGVSDFVAADNAQSIVESVNVE